MRSTAFVLVLLAAVSVGARAQQCPDIAPYQRARDTIQDLGRIVTPNGGLTAYREESRYFFNAPLLSPEYWAAPAKQAVWFERSSHMIPWEEPGKMLLSLVQYVRPLAEPNENRH